MGGCALGRVHEAGRRERSGAAELANYQLFLSELCDIIGVPHPNRATDHNSQNQRCVYE